LKQAIVNLYFMTSLRGFCEEAEEY